jgi:hypothetical protein
MPYTEGHPLRTNPEAVAPGDWGDFCKVLEVIVCDGQEGGDVRHRKFYTLDGLLLGKVVNPVPVNLDRVCLGQIEEVLKTPGKEVMAALVEIDALVTQHFYGTQPAKEVAT